MRCLESPSGEHCYWIKTKASFGGIIFTPFTCLHFCCLVGKFEAWRYDNHLKPWGLIPACSRWQDDDAKDTKSLRIGHGVSYWFGSWCHWQSLVVPSIAHCTDGVARCRYLPQVPSCTCHWATFPEWSGLFLYLFWCEANALISIKITKFD